MITLAAHCAHRHHIHCVLFKIKLPFGIPPSGPRRSWTCFWSWVLDVHSFIFSRLFTTLDNMLRSPSGKFVLFCFVFPKPAALLLGVPTCGHSALRRVCAGDSGKNARSVKAASEPPPCDTKPAALLSLFVCCCAHRHNLWQTLITGGPSEGTITQQMPPHPPSIKLVNTAEQRPAWIVCLLFV